MFKFEIKGLDEIERAFDDLARRAENLSGPVKFSELFPPEFMRRYSDFVHIDDLAEASGFHCETTEDFEKIPADQWNAHIVASTRFSSWEEMKDVAGREYAQRRLGLDAVD